MKDDWENDEINFKERRSEIEKEKMKKEEKKRGRKKLYLSIREEMRIKKRIEV